MDKHTMLLTPEGLKELKKEYDDLMQVKRPEAVERLAHAREGGDLSENSEYTAARESLAFIDGRITEIEDILNGAKTIRHKTVGKSSKIDIGCKVYLNVNGKKEVFTIVGEWEADPIAKKISHESPLGKALLGKGIGEIVAVEAPVGKIEYKILKIE